MIDRAQGLSIKDYSLDLLSYMLSYLDLHALFAKVSVKKFYRAVTRAALHSRGFRKLLQLTRVSSGEC